MFKPFTVNDLPSLKLGDTLIAIKESTGIYKSLGTIVMTFFIIDVSSIPTAVRFRSTQGASSTSTESHAYITSYFLGLPNIKFFLVCPDPPEELPVQTNEALIVEPNL